MSRGTVSDQTDFDGWRETARRFLADNVAPDLIVWEVRGETMPHLFAKSCAPVRRLSVGSAIRIPHDFLHILRRALLHNDPSRFAIAYRLLWRMRGTPSLVRDPADPDMIAIRLLAKAVQRDMHKMHAFVRFRKVGNANGRECFAAWFEPDHHIERAVAGFFRDRFTAMDWLIVTPKASIRWNGANLFEGPGGSREDVPQTDAVEAEWRAYYRSIFNPARVKVNAMKREMPVRYWRNLPEASLITSLVQSAPARVAVMVREKPKRDLANAQSPSPLPGAPHFASLNNLYDALCAQDFAPAPTFSSQIVLGEGPRNAQIMFVGEQPGDQEDLARRPFIGPAGRLLNDCLKAAGIERETVFLTNAVKRFKYEPRGKRRIHQTPTTADIVHYRWWLAEEIRLINPEIVVALGATALHALTGRKQPLGPLRGAVIPSQGRQVMITVHPSFLLRLADEQALNIERGKFVRDLTKVQRKVTGDWPIAAAQI